MQTAFTQSAPTNSEVWLTAISKAERHKKYDSAAAVDYLLHLKLLAIGGPNQSHRVRWSEPPQFVPPPPLWENTTGFYQPVEIDPYSHLQRDLNDAQVDEIASLMPMMAVSNQSFNTGANTNHFSVLNTDDDDELSDEEIVYHPPSSDHSNNHADSNNDASPGSSDHVSSSDKDMSMRRILLRVYCSLAEIQSNWAVECSKNRKWADGADEFENAYTTLRCGQEIIDEEHAWLAQIMESISLLDEGNSQAVRLEYHMNERQKCIDLDSEVVSVPLAFFSVSKDKYVHAAQSRIAYLEDKLFEDNATRDEVMRAMGSRWKNNPRPSNNYADRKRALERELDEALEGMNRTQRMDVGGMGGSRVR